MIIENLVGLYHSDGHTSLLPEICMSVTMELSMASEGIILFLRKRR